MSKFEIFLKNINIETDKRKDFDDIIFEIIFVSNMYFLNVAREKKKANKTSSLKSEIASDIVDKINSLNLNNMIKNVNNEIKNDFKIIDENVANKTSYKLREFLSIIIFAHVDVT